MPKIASLLFAAIAPAAMADSEPKVAKVSATAPQVCIAVHVDPSIRTRNDEAYDRQITGVFGNRLATLLKEQGIEQHIDKQLKISVIYGVTQPNRACERDDVIRVTLDYLPRKDREKFRSELRILQFGTILFSEDNIIDASHVSVRAGASKTNRYISLDLERLAESVYSKILWK
jgi:hypothetical protein